MSAGISAALTMARPPVPAPTGRVALVATRVEGARALWDHDPEATSAGLRLGTALLKRLLVDHRGYEVTADGEGMLLAFPDALSAARWSLDAQEALLRAEWPQALLQCPGAEEAYDGDTLIARGLRVGMAVHHGTPEAVHDARTERTEYEGPEVDWVRQVGHAVHGGQILLTAEAWAGVEEAGSHLLDADVTDLGKHRFAGREDAATLYQLLPWSLANRAFPSVRTGLQLRTNLPSDPGLFVGRERLLGAIDRYYQKGRKIVVLKGHGGMGKTRLAVRYGGLHVHEYAGGGGVWICDLAEARSIDGICHAVARALGISLRSRSMQATQQLGMALASRGRCLLILDNFEQVQRYAEYTVALWARKAPRLRMLVTSRHRLHVRGEALLEITPLDTDHASDLFRARAEDLRPDLQISPDDPDLARILEQVQCVPLAVELAAAWVSVLTLPGIAARLDEGHKALEGVDVDVERRHASLRAVMNSAWELLKPYEQEALITCATFRGGFTPEAAQAVMDLTRFRTAPGPFQVLKSLRDKSLVHTSESPRVPGAVRWNLYDAVREFASEKLVQSGMRPTAEKRHARYYLGLGAQQRERLRGPEAVDALATLEVEVDNLRAVHERFVDRQPMMGMNAALALDAVLGAHGPFDLHLEVLERAVAAGQAIKGSLQVPVRAALIEALLQRGRLNDAADAVSDGLLSLRVSDEPDVKEWLGALNGWVLVQLGRVQDGSSALQAAQEHLVARPDHPHTPTLAFRMALLHLQHGELDEAQEILDASLKAASKRGDPWMQADIATALGDLARQRGKPSVGRTRYEEALALAEALGDRPREGRLLSRLGSLALDVRQSEEAERCFEAACERAMDVGDVVEAAIIQGNMGRMRHHEGRGKEADEAYTKVLEDLTEAGATRWVGIFRGVMGALEHEQGRMEDAQAAYQASVQVLEACGDRRFAGLVHARLGALHADLGHTHDAERAYAAAQAHLDAVADPLGQAALEVHRGHLDLARARAGHAPSRKQARARFKQATTPSRDGTTLVQPPAAISNDVRLALRLLRRSMELGDR